LSKLLETKPITIKKANEFVQLHHRHHRPTSRNTGKWAIAAVDVNEDVVGVVIAGNPVSATYMDGLTIELTRLCVKEGAPKGSCSFLLSKACSIWRTMGGERILTYTLASESGSSLKGAGWSLEGVVKPHNRWANKSKVDGIERANLQIYQLKKYRWEKSLKKAV